MTVIRLLTKDDLWHLYPVKGSQGEVIFDPPIPGPLGSRWFDWPHFRDDRLGRFHVLPVAIRNMLGIESR